MVLLLICLELEFKKLHNFFHIWVDKRQSLTMGTTCRVSGKSRAARLYFVKEFIYVRIFLHSHWVVECSFSFSRDPQMRPPSEAIDFFFRNGKIFFRKFFTRYFVADVLKFSLNRLFRLLFVNRMNCFVDKRKHVLQNRYCFFDDEYFVEECGYCIHPWIALWKQ